MVNNGAAWSAKVHHPPGNLSCLSVRSDVTFVRISDCQSGVNERFMAAVTVVSVVDISEGVEGLLQWVLDLDSGVVSFCSCFCCCHCHPLSCHR